MPEEKFPTPEINLLSGDELESGPQGKFIKWALTWGKRIVVLTELVVISAFLSRFWLDTTVANLNEEIDHRKAVVTGTAGFETTFRVVQARVAKAQLIEKKVSVLEFYDSAEKLIPGNVVVNQISIGKKGISFTGQASETAMAGLVAAFRNSADFADIGIERIAKQDKSLGVDFSFSASYGRK